METPEGYQKREFVRVAVDLKARYKFLSPHCDKVDNRVFEGTTSNISAGGLLLKGQLPGNDWVVDLLLYRVVIGLNLLLPDSDVPLKALARVAWIESLTAQGDCSMGLLFKEVERDTQDRIVQFIIRSQMP